MNYITSVLSGRSFEREKRLGLRLRIGANADDLAIGRARKQVGHGGEIGGDGHGRGLEAARFVGRAGRPNAGHSVERGCDRTVVQQEDRPVFFIYIDGDGQLRRSGRRL